MSENSRFMKWHTKYEYLFFCDSVICFFANEIEMRITLLYLTYLVLADSVFSAILLFISDRQVRTSSLHFV